MCTASLGFAREASKSALVFADLLHTLRRQKSVLDVLAHVEVFLHVQLRLERRLHRASLDCLQVQTVEPRVLENFFGVTLRAKSLRAVFLQQLCDDINVFVRVLDLVGALVRVYDF